MQTLQTSKQQVQTKLEDLRAPNRLPTVGGREEERAAANASKTKRDSTQDDGIGCVPSRKYWFSLKKFDGALIRWETWSGGKTK
jgi:hypothetical protein